MAAPCEDSACRYDFMYPDLLSKDGLLYVLKQRYISHTHGDLDSLDKEALVDLYNRFILPLPQRTYRQNRKGQQMTQAQKVNDRKRKIHFLDRDVNTNTTAKRKSLAAGPSTGLINHHNSPSKSVSRLKPPPSCINFEKKVIRLKSDIKQYEMKKSGDAPSKTSDIVSEKSEFLVKANPIGSATLKEKRNTSCSSAASTASSDGFTNDVSPTKKKKIAPISWP
ncbi:Ashwin [Plakobranchus ocellatus]|uniref:Ashwin n=1 Tax=Plakobranchus ocellatus TaxID=259542 RepID=A0AAV4C5R8_9GAST|nr:Ashwin [Plakobranchus ocellatus]